MIFAELKGKLGSDYGRASDRSEDVLTSNVFGLLRYLPPQVLLDVLSRVRPVRAGAGATVDPPDPAWLPAESGTSWQIEFWPNWRGFGQPDLVLSLLAAGRVVDRVVVEVKLHSGKSQLAGNDLLTDNDDADEEEDRPSDQLVRYWKGLPRHDRTGPDAIRSGVVFLTADAAPPIKDLTESIEREPEMRLAWLSWLDVWSALERFVAGGPAFPFDVVAGDLLDLLSHKGLRDFGGFHFDAAELPVCTPSWASAGWLSGEALDGLKAAQEALRAGRGWILEPNMTRGEALKQTVLTLRRIHKDVCEIINTLDRLMEPHRWEPTEKGRISEDLSNDLNKAGGGDTWVIGQLFRIYRPRAETNGTRRIVGIQIEFATPPDFPEPMIVLAAARFPTPQTDAAIWNLWQGAGATPVLEHLSVEGKTEPLPPPVLAAFLKGAAFANVEAIKLCELMSTADLQNRIVEPLLDMDAKLP